MIPFLDLQRPLPLLSKLLAGILIAAGCLGLLRVFLTQEVVEVAGGLGWDGVHYNRLLEFFLHGEFTGDPASFPFCSRLGTPWLLSFIAIERFGFYEFNILCGVLFSVLMVIFTRPIWRFGPRPLFGLCSVVFASTFLFFSPLRFSTFYPVYMDPPFMLVSVVAFAFCLRGQYLAAALVCFFAIPFREASVYILPLLLVFYVVGASHRILAMAISVSMFFTALWFSYWLVSVTDCEGRSQLLTGFLHLYAVLSSPSEFLSVIAAISMTVGPAFILTRRTDINPLSQDPRMVFSIASVGYFALLSSVGGSDVTRIFYSFLPFYIGLLAFCFTRATLVSFSLSIFGWILTNQSLNKYLQPAADWPSRDLVGFFSQFPDHAHPVVSLSILLVWFILRWLAKRIEPFEATLQGRT